MDTVVEEDWSKTVDCIPIKTATIGLVLSLPRILPTVSSWKQPRSKTKKATTPIKTHLSTELHEPRDLFPLRGTPNEG